MREGLVCFNYVEKNFFCEVIKFVYFWSHMLIHLCIYVLTSRDPKTTCFNE